MNGTGSIWYQLGIDNSQLQRDADKSSKIFRGIGDTAESEGARIDNIVRRLTSGIAAMGLSLSAGALIKQIASVRGEFQQLEIAFETMLGSKERADSLMSQLVTTAAKTPFNLTGVATGAKQLLAYGTAADEVNDTLIRLGNIASGLSIPLNDLVYLYGTTQVQGRLFTQDVRQFMGRGIPLVKELAKELGKTEGEINDMVTAGKIGFPEVQKVINNLTNEGGMFFNLMEKQSASLTGKISNLQDSWDMMLNDIGSKSEGVFTGSIEITTSLIENYEKVGEVLLSLVSVYGAYKAAVIAVSVIEKARTAIMMVQATSTTALTTSQAAQIIVTRQLTIAQAMLNKTMLANPYVLATMAVVALGYATYKLITHQTDAEKAQSRLNDSMKESEKASITETRELARLKDELSAAKKGTEEYNAIKEKIVKNYGKYYDGLDKEIEKVGSLETTYNKLTDAIKKSFGARQYEKFIKSEIDNLDTTLNDNLSKIQERIYGKFDDKEAAAKYFANIRSALIEGRELDKSTLSILDYVQDKGTLKADSRVDGYIRKIREADAIFAKIDAEARVKFDIEDDAKKTDSGTEAETKKVKTLTEQVNEAKKGVANLKTELQNLRSGKTQSANYAKDIEDKAKELKDAEDKLSYLLYGKASSKKSGGANTDDIAQKKVEAQEWLLEKQKELNNQQIKSALELEQKLLDIENDSFEKQQKQNELNHRKELLSIKEFEANRISQQQEVARKMYIKEKGSDKGFDFAKFDTSTLPEGLKPEDIQAQVKDLISAVQSAWEKSDEVAYKSETERINELLAKHQDYNAKRLAIEKQYQKDLEGLNELTDSEQKNAAVTQLEKDRKASIKAVNDEEAAELVKTTDLFVRLFTDASQQSVRQIRKVIDETQALYDYLANTKDEDITANFGFTAEQLRTFKGDAEQLKAILDGLIAKKKELAGKSEFQAFAQSIGDAVKKIKQGGIENIGAGVTDIGNAINQITPQIKQFGNDLGTIFGDEKLAEDIGLATDALAGLGSTASGIGQIMAGDVVGGIKSVVSGVSSLVGVFNSIVSSSNAKETAETISRLTSSNEELKVSVDALREEIAGTNGTKSIQAYNEAVAAQDRYNENLRQILDAQMGYHSSHHSNSYYWNLNSNSLKEVNKLLGTSLKNTWGDFSKLTADQMNEIRKYLPDVWSEMINQGKYGDRFKDDWNNYADQAGKVAEMTQDLRENIAQISFDSLRDSFVNALMDMDSDAKDFAGNFEEYLTKALLNFAIGDLLDDQMKKWYESWADTINKQDGKLTDEQIAQYKKEWDAMVQMGIDKRDEIAAMTGYTGNNDSDRQATAKGVATASQDSVNELNGRFSVIQSHTYELNENVKGIHELTQGICIGMNELKANTSTILKHVQNIDNNTNVIKGDISLMREDINSLVLHGVTLKK